MPYALYVLFQLLQIHFNYIFGTQKDAMLHVDNISIHARGVRIQYDIPHSMILYIGTGVKIFSLQKLTHEMPNIHG